MNLKNFRLILVFIVFITVIFTNCMRNNIKGIAIGKVSEINLCVPLSLYTMVEKPLMEELYEEVFLPVRESIFTIGYVSLDKLRILKKAKNLLFIANINRSDEYSKIIKSFLNENNLASIRKDSVSMFQIFDGYADGQNILIIAGVNDTLIKNFILKNGELIRNFFKHNSYRAIEKMVYITGENKRLEKQTNEKIHIDMKIPSDYGTSFYDSMWNIYSIIAHKPERIITLGILKDIPFDYKSIFDIRNRIGKKYWDGDYIDTSFVKLKIDTLSFKGYKTIEIMGVWSNDIKNYGGPFLSYIVKYNNKILYLDGQILLPGKRKFFKLMELKSIMYSIENIK